MVSIRYFWRVGEFRCVKSRPRGSFASKIGTARPSRESLWMKSHRLILLIRCYEIKPSRTRTPFESALDAFQCRDLPPDFINRARNGEGRRLCAPGYCFPESETEPS